LTLPRRALTLQRGYGVWSQLQTKVGPVQLLCLIKRHLGPTAVRDVEAEDRVGDVLLLQQLLQGVLLWAVQ
jgi:hypothetical protein